MKRYKENDLRELYRVENKYWKTGDVDYLPRTYDLAQRIEANCWECITSLAGFVARQRKPYAVLVDALKVLGYESEEKGAEDDSV